MSQINFDIEEQLDKNRYQLDLTPFIDDGYTSKFNNHPDEMNLHLTKGKHFITIVLSLAFNLDLTDFPIIYIIDPTRKNHESNC